MCPVQISKLPEITEETLPKWEEMEKNKTYSCTICGKPDMNLSRYDEHTTTKHQCDLEKPDFEEFDTARGAFLIDVERINPEDLKTAYWDYDSEAGKRYSEDESGEESNNDDTIKIKKKVNQPSGYASSGGSSSSSSSEHSSDSSKKKQRIYRKLPSQKKPSS